MVKHLDTSVNEISRNNLRNTHTQCWQCLNRPLFCKKTDVKQTNFCKKTDQKQTNFRQKTDHIAIHTDNIYTENTLTIYGGKNQPGPLLLASKLDSPNIFKDKDKDGHKLLIRKLH